MSDIQILKEGGSFYHPPTDTFITWKVNGDLDIETGDGGTGEININIKSENVTIGSENVTIGSGG